MEKYKEVAVDIARKAGAIMLANFSLGMARDWKGDNTPLTLTDTSINKLVIDELSRNFPDHAIIGEEESKLRESEYAWVCDPVDGTVPFSHGYALFTFSLALTHNGESILGVVYDPTNDRMFVAEKGKGAFLNDQKISVSSKSDLKAGLINIEAKKGLADFRNTLVAHGAHVTVFYASVFPGALIACGEFVAIVCEYPYPWDAAAIKVIIEEAGGRVTDIAGNDQRYDRPINGFIASNGLVHDEIVRLAAETLSA